MDTQESKDKPEEPPSKEGLIKQEWEIIYEMKKLIKDPDLTVSERTKAATVFAYHANILNRLLGANGGKEEFQDQNLGDYIRGVEPRIARRVRRDFRVWKRTLSSRR